MLYDISNNKLPYWREFDELGGRKDFEFAVCHCWCGAKGGKLVSNTTRHRNQYNFVECENCGTIRINPYLTDEGIEKYYREVYGAVKRHNVLPEKLYKKQAKAGKLVFELVKKFINHQSKILDFGAGAGGKMDELLKQGYEVYIKEVDKNHFDYGVSKGLKPFDAGLKYNFIFLSRILEHMNDPEKFLHEVKALLAEGGHIYIEVPMIENARDGELLTEFHISHKWYFSSENLKQLCAKVSLTPVHESRNLIISKSIDK
jgi:SAM-dependent methyltransferase